MTVAIVDRALARGVAIIRKEHLPRAQGLAKLAAELEDQIETVKTVNQQLAEAGDGRRVASIERTACPLTHPALENFIGMVDELRLSHPQRPFHDLLWPDLNRNPTIFGTEIIPPECWSKP